MRPRIVNLDVDQIAWKPLGPAGLYSRELSRDPDTGARTALQRLCPADDYQPPKVAHYHHTYEEIIGISGCFSFDSRLWIERGTYVFHPPETVHGFKSAIREESTFLSRVGRDLDFNFVDTPDADDLYSVAATPCARVPAVSSARDNFAKLQEGLFLGGKATCNVLSRDPETGEGSALVVLEKGWQSDIVSVPAYLEIFVMDGGLSVNGDSSPEGRGYFFYPPGDRIEPLLAERPTTAYVNFGDDIGL